MTLIMEKCEKCSLQFKSKKAAWLHMNKSHRVKSRKTFKIEKRYDFSRFVKFSDKSTQIVAGKDTPVSKTAIGEKQQSVQSSGNDFQCLLCDLEFVTREQLVAHSYDKHVFRDVDTFSEILCDICTKKFKSKGDLMFHITFLHEEQQIVTCELCPNLGRSISSGLKLHNLKAHTGHDNEETIPDKVDSTETAIEENTARSETLENSYTVQNVINKPLDNSPKIPKKLFKRAGGEQIFTVQDIVDESVNRVHKSFKKYFRRVRKKDNNEEGKPNVEATGVDEFKTFLGNEQHAHRKDDMSYFNPLKAPSFSQKSKPSLRKHLNYLLGGLGKPKIPKDDPDEAEHIERAIKEINNGIHLSLSIETNFKEHTKKGYRHKVSKSSRVNKFRKSRILLPKKNYLTPMLKRYNWFKDPTLPKGWRKRGQKRKKTTNRTVSTHIDHYYLSPCGKQVRSRAEMKSFIRKKTRERNNSDSRFASQVNGRAAFKDEEDGKCILDNDTSSGYKSFSEYDSSVLSNASGSGTDIIDSSTASIDDADVGFDNNHIVRTDDERVITNQSDPNCAEADRMTYDSVDEKEPPAMSNSFIIQNSYFEQKVVGIMSDLKVVNSFPSLTKPSDLISRYKWVGDTDLPAGWKKRFINGEKTPYCDCYFLSPCGKQLKSAREMEVFISKNKKVLGEEKYFKFLIQFSINK